MNILLIGYRGTGKTTVARLLGEKLGMPHIDADELLQQRAGRTIAEIFTADGEGVFRDLESSIVKELAAGDSQVIGLGGGAILREENREAIAAGGLTVWLQASVETIHRRMTGDVTTAASRPNLTAAGGLEEIRQVLQERTPLYEAAADAIVDTDGKTPEQVADEIVALARTRLDA